MYLIAQRVLLAGVLALPAASLRAQPFTLPDKEPLERTASTSANAGPIGLVPFPRGFNATFAATPQHDASNGWTTIFTPGVAYRFNPKFSLSASLPIFTTVHVEVQRGTKKKPVYTSRTARGVLGDLPISFSAIYPLRGLEGTLTTTVGLPTGKQNYGLGAGQVTYNINNHVEYPFGRIAPDVELGIGDTSGLVNRRIRRDYTSVGTILHVQAGAAVALPHNLLFTADAYEEMPLGYNTVYSTAGKGKKKVTTSLTTPTAAEDNGVFTSLDMPVLPHVTLSGFYTRSIRSHDDVAGFSITLLLRAPPTVEELLQP